MYEIGVIPSPQSQLDKIGIGLSECEIYPKSMKKQKLLESYDTMSATLPPQFGVNRRKVPQGLYGVDDAAESN
jgi:hypothetical protein